MSHGSLHCILSPALLHRLAQAGSEPTRAAALETLAREQSVQAGPRLAESASRTGGREARPVTFATRRRPAQVTIYDQRNSDAQSLGTVARSQGQPPVKDKAVNQAYDGLEATYDYYWSTFKRDSIDGQGEPLLGLVHYSKNYDNAFFDGAGHMFFGDGDGQILTQTTAGIDVIGHELTHGVTQNEANLVYSGQSGALNESISDVFGIQIKQRVLNQDASTSDWLIGEEIVGPELKFPDGRPSALRSMEEPGKANPHDDQPADMDGYVAGGDVHTNSGIPNRAFAVAATTLGGHSWDVAGPVWYVTLRDPALTPNATFQQFARLTVKHARRTYGGTSKEGDAFTVRWDAVKVAL